MVQPRPGPAMDLNGPPTRPEPPSRNPARSSGSSGSSGCLGGAPGAAPVRVAGSSTSSRSSGSTASDESGGSHMRSPSVSPPTPQVSPRQKSIRTSEPTPASHEASRYGTPTFEAPSAGPRDHSASRLPTMELAGTHTDEPPGELDEMLENPPLLDWLAAQPPLNEPRFSTAIEARHAALRVLAVHSNIRRCHYETQRRRLYIGNELRHTHEMAMLAARLLLGLGPGAVACRWQIHYVFTQALLADAKRFVRPETVPAKVVFEIERTVYARLEPPHFRHFLRPCPSEYTMRTNRLYTQSVKEAFNLLFANKLSAFLHVGLNTYNEFVRNGSGSVDDAWLNLALDILPDMRLYREFRHSSDELARQLLHACHSDAGVARAVLLHVRDLGDAVRGLDVGLDSPLEAYDAAVYGGMDEKVRAHAVALRQRLGGGRLQRLYEQLMRDVPQDFSFDEHFATLNKLITS